MNNGININIRLRRLRYNPVIRNLIRETELSINDLVYPVFVRSGEGIKNPIIPMPGCFQFSIDMLDEEIHEIVSLGIESILLFGIPAIKDDLGSDSYDDMGIIQQAIRKIKSLAPQLMIISDVCLCQYTEHGHCGVVSEDHNCNIDLNNDETLKLLSKQAISHVRAGADAIAPAGMIDGMVKALRTSLDEHGFTKTPIISYSIKYRSAMYGPFAAAAEGAVKKGDRSTYQMDIANSNEAVREALLDIEEGADILMVKPAHGFLDIIYKIKQTYPYMPLAAFHVSGEYSMLKAAIQNGWLDEKRAILEVVTSIKRAGADIIITYFAKDIARFLKN
jgi:porphobilinogen synthase